MSHVVAHLLCFLLVALAVYWPGRTFERYGGPGDLPQTTRFLYGLAWWTVGLFLLAALGRLTPFGLVAWAGLTAVTTHRLRRGRRRGGRRARVEPLDRPSLPARLLTWNVLAVIAFPLLIIALGPTRSWDAEVYHLSVPALWAEHGGFRDVEMNVYSHWPMGTQLFYGAAMVVQDFILAKTIHFGFGLLTFLALVEGLGKRAAAGFTAAVLFFANDVVLFEMRVAYVDLSQAFYTVAAFLFLARAADRDDPAARNRLLGSAGIAAGLLAGSKVTGIVGAGVLLLAVYLPRLLKDASLYGPRFALAGPAKLYALPTAFFLVPWWIKSAVYTGNPFYPLFHRVFGGPDWSPAVAEQFAAWQRSIGMGREVSDYLLLPLRVIVSGELGYDTFDGKVGLFWLLALPLALLSAVLSKKRNGKRALLAAFGLFLFWALSSQQMRFLIPALALASFAVGDALPRNRGAWMAPALALVLLGTATVYPRLVHTAHRYTRIFLSDGFDPARAEPAVARAVDALPGDAKLLLLHANQRFALSREVLADSFFEASQIADWLRDCPTVDCVDERLRTRGVTHVLIKKEPPRVDYPRTLLDLVTRSEPIYRDRHYLLFELRDGAPTDP